MYIEEYLFQIYTHNTVYFTDPQC